MRIIKNGSCVISNNDQNSSPPRPIDCPEYVSENMLHISHLYLIYIVQNIVVHRGIDCTFFSTIYSGIVLKLLVCVEILLFFQAATICVHQPQFVCIMCVEHFYTIFFVAFVLPNLVQMLIHVYQILFTNQTTQTTVCSGSVNFYLSCRHNLCASCVFNTFVPFIFYFFFDLDVFVKLCHFDYFEFYVRNMCPKICVRNMCPKYVSKIVVTHITHIFHIFDSIHVLTIFSCSNCTQFPSANVCPKMLSHISHICFTHLTVFKY